MICKNCGKYTSLDWVECPTCGYLHNAAEFTKLLDEYRNYIKERNFIKAKIVLEKALKIARYSTKEEQILKQLDKLNRIIKNSDYYVAPPPSVEALRESEYYVKPLVIAKVEKEEDREKIGRLKYGKNISKNQLLLIILLSPILFYFLFLYRFRDKEEFPTKIERIETKQVAKKTEGEKIYIPEDDIYKIDKVLAKIETGEVFIDNAKVLGEYKINNSVFTKTIKTNEKSKVVLNIENSIVLIDENSEVEIEESKKTDTFSKVRLKLNKGTIFSEVKKLRANDKFEISTPISTVGVRGTKFLVEAVTDLVSVFCMTGKIAILPQGSDNYIELKSGDYCASKKGEIPKVQQYDNIQKLRLEKYNNQIQNSKLSIPINADFSDDIIKENKKSVIPSNKIDEKKSDKELENLEEKVLEKLKDSSKIDKADKPETKKIEESGGAALKSDNRSDTALFQKEKKDKSSELYEFGKSKYKEEYGKKGEQILKKDIKKAAGSDKLAEELYN
ncbi:MAG TPA: FecR family protein, partial [bacterium]|nr:FecR family protein [bacterium]